MSRAVQRQRGERVLVLLDEYEVVAARLLRYPNKWYLVGGGDADRFAVLRQTAYRIRRGLIRAFLPRPGGRFEAKVSSVDLGGSPNRLYEVEVYARWVPVTPTTTRADRATR